MQLKGTVSILQEMRAMEPPWEKRKKKKKPLTHLCIQDNVQMCDENEF
jgi:hypothetical protein